MVIRYCVNLFISHPPPPQLVYGHMEEADTLIEDLCRDKVRAEI